MGYRWYDAQVRPWSPDRRGSPENDLRRTDLYPHFPTHTQTSAQNTTPPSRTPSERGGGRARQRRPCPTLLPPHCSLAVTGPVSPTQGATIYATVCNTAGPSAAEVAPLSMGFPAATGEPPTLCVGGWGGEGL